MESESENVGERSQRTLGLISGLVWGEEMAEM